MKHDMNNNTTNNNTTNNNPNYVLTASQLWWFRSATEMLVRELDSRIKEFNFSNESSTFILRNELQKLIEDTSPEALHKKS
jgi:hypothetical protein